MITYASLRDRRPWGKLDSVFQNKRNKTSKKGSKMKLYYHKTDGGAEYLTDKWTRNLDGSKEGVFKNARYIVRIDGNIRREGECMC